ncbi:ATP-dependent DNA helicase RecG [Congregibacter litoralis]|uniref:ATP-dependent DNA helicase RecG n=1 Tax=Congregibacter litoralis KT71 TaxID=314285 RepID=A4A9A1_9GAMM|nr:ATP-dependent DNA helicase RecG [Congregibacter litoralis]EAQ97643.1 ATP-dependent DNA helicase RecG [Congregibacter litoralis KT71]
MSGIVTQSLESLRGVGPKMAERLQRYGISNVEDLLFHLPLRYQDRTQVTPIGALQDGAEVVIEGDVALVSVSGGGRRRSLIVKLQDGTGTATLRFFHFSQAQKNALQQGDRLRCFGTVRRGAQQAEMIHPEYRRSIHISDNEESLTPIYPSTEGVSQGQWRKLSDQALSVLAKHPPEELLPVRENDYGLSSALRFLHRPPPEADQQALRDGRHPAQLRLALEELTAHQLSMREMRARSRERAAPVLRDSKALSQHFLKALPFEPTAAQLRVMEEITADLATEKPMLRLVQGDVGSGKTVVAAAAALIAIASGYQVAVMAPTELLAEQHRRNFAGWFSPLNISQMWLAGSVKGQKREQALAAIESGEASLVIGTHALFQDGVEFAHLGLVIVDEQHRFGVHQRLALSEKTGGAWRAHQLIMTATPIPRTLSMVAYADLDCSIIDELPPGRQPVGTVLIDNQRRQEIIERVAIACREGRQVYWVCTLIEDSDTLQAQAAESSFAELAEALDGIAVAMVHGRMKAKEKDAVMSAFKAGHYQLLVATTVIEVGVDVPNATLMIIENPERLGLAQLHQLRGRVGRGSAASHCVLLYQSPLGQQSRARLQVMRESNDGFYIAEEDLRQRGPGEVLGTRQTGLMEFRVARLPEHEHLLEEVQEIAEALQQEHPQWVQALIRRWAGDRQAFANV